MSGIISPFGKSGLFTDVRGLIERIVSPFCFTSFYALSTGSSVKFATSETLSGSQPGINLNYRIMNNSGSMALTSGNLSGICVAIYGGIGS